MVKIVESSQVLAHVETQRRGVTASQVIAYVETYTKRVRASQLMVYIEVQNPFPSDPFGPKIQVI